MTGVLSREAFIQQLFIHRPSIGLEHAVNSYEEIHKLCMSNPQPAATAVDPLDEARKAVEWMLKWGGHIWRTADGWQAKVKNAAGLTEVVAEGKWYLDVVIAAYRKAGGK